MDPSMDAEVSALSAAASTATQVRVLAHERIISAFRQQLCGAGPGPTDDELQSFARVALVEQSLTNHLGRVVANSSVRTGT